MSDDLTNYDKLTLEIWTDGTVAAKDALMSLQKFLISYFEQIVIPKKLKKSRKL